MEKDAYKLIPFSETGIMVTFGNEIKEEIHQKQVQTPLAEQVQPNKRQVRRIY